MRRERSTSIASNQSNSKGQSPFLKHPTIKAIPSNHNTAAKIHPPQGSKPSIKSTRASLNSSSSSALTQGKLKSRDLLTSRERSLAKSGSKGFLQVKKENIHPNTNPINIGKDKDKNRTIKDVRLKNTKKQASISQRQLKSPLKKTANPINNITIAIHAPQERVQISKTEVDEDSGQLQQILKYIPPLHLPKRQALSDFRILRTISQASYFRDTLALHLQSATVYTLRIIDKQQVRNQQKTQQLMEAIKMHLFLSRLHLPHLQQLYTVFEDPCSIYLLLEPRVPEKFWYHSSKGRWHQMQEAELALFTKQILETLQVVHQNRIVLRSLDDKYIKSQFGLFKIGLVDCACSLGHRKRRNSFLGVSKEVPHEFVEKQSYDYNYDLWTLGLTVYSLVTGTHPFQTAQPFTAIQELSYDIPMSASKELGELINCLLVQEDRRISVAQALQHNFIKKNLREKLLVPRDLWSFWESN